MPAIPPELAAQLSDRARAWLSEDVPHGDGRVVWLEHGAKPVIIDGRAHVEVGGFDPIVWLCDDDGRLIELDDLGETFYRADSLAHRVEQLSLERERPVGQPAVHAGKVGEALAAARGLVSVPEASDSYRRIWMQPPGAPRCQVIESLEPSAYGKKDLVQRTYVYEAGRAKKSAPSKTRTKKPQPNKTTPKPSSW